MLCDNAHGEYVANTAVESLPLIVNLVSGEGLSIDTLAGVERVRACC